MEEILREILAADKTILSRRDDLLAALEKKVTGNLMRDYTPIKKAVSLNVGEIFFVGESDREITKAKVTEILKSSGMQEARIKFVIETFEKALDWDKFPEVEDFSETFDDEKSPAVKSMGVEEYFKKAKAEKIAEEYRRKKEESQQRAKVSPPPPSTAQTPPLQVQSQTPSQNSNSASGRNFFIVFLCILALVCYLASGSSAKGELSLGGVDLGETVDVMKKNFGNPTASDAYGQYFYGGNSNYNFITLVQTNNSGKIKFLSTKSPELKTYRGIHVGSTFEEMINKYGYDYNYSRDNQDVVYSYSLKNFQNQEGRMHFRVDFNTNKITWIWCHFN